MALWAPPWRRFNTPLINLAFFAERTTTPAGGFTHPASARASFPLVHAGSWSLLMYSFQETSTKVMSFFSAVAITSKESCRRIISTAAGRDLLVLWMTCMLCDAPRLLALLVTSTSVVRHSAVRGTGENGKVCLLCNDAGDFTCTRASMWCSDPQRLPVLIMISTVNDGSAMSDDLRALSIRNQADKAGLRLTPKPLWGSQLSVDGPQNDTPY